MLDNRTAVITGCLKGIGLKTLEVFAMNHATIFACAQYETDDFKVFIAELQSKYAVDIFPVYFDFMDSGQIKEAAKTIHKYKRRIDILVNIAGMTSDAIMQMVSSDDAKKVFEVNYFSQILFSQFILKMMISSGNSGSIINVSSISALDGNKGQLTYSATKGSIVSATKTMSIELGPLGIRVNAVAPGTIDTEMTQKVPTEIIEKQIAKTSLKRIGTPEEVANVIMFLGSDQSSYITGQIIRIDGGM